METQGPLPLPDTSRRAPGVRVWSIVGLAGTAAGAVIGILGFAAILLSMIATLSDSGEPAFLATLHFLEAAAMVAIVLGYGLLTAGILSLLVAGVLHWKKRHA